VQQNRVHPAQDMVPGQTLLSTLLDWPWGFTKEGPFLEY